MNVDWLSHLPEVMRRGLYFGLQGLIGSRIHSRYNEFKDWQNLKENDLNARVHDRLKQRLDHALEHSEYYRELGISVSEGDSAFDILARLPILDRVTLRKNFKRIVIDSHRQQITGPESVSTKRYDWVTVKTGGTTGSPTTVVHDANCRDWGRASRLIANEMCGIFPGKPYFRLWGSEQDLLNQKEKPTLSVMRALMAEIPMNAFRAKEAELRRHTDTLNSHSDIRNLVTYADAGMGLASFIEDNELPRPKLDTVIATSGTLLPEWRKLIQDVFGAEVYDKYGSRECTEIAVECSCHDGLHIFSPQVYVEIVNEQGKSCKPGETGRILISMLNNSVFPMLRYEIGDLAIPGEAGKCDCGLSFPKIKSLEGRNDDVLFTQDGTPLTSGFIRHFVGVSLNRHLIREWQFEQTDRTSFTFSYIPVNRSGLEENLSKICDSFRLTLGEKAEINLNEVKEIPQTSTGKFRWILNSYAKTRNKSDSTDSPS